MLQIYKELSNCTASKCWGGAGAKNVKSLIFYRLQKYSTDFIQVNSWAKISIFRAQNLKNEKVFMKVVGTKVLKVFDKITKWFIGWKSDEYWTSLRLPFLGIFLTIFWHFPFFQLLNKSVFRILWLMGLPSITRGHGIERAVK